MLHVLAEKIKQTRINPGEVVLIEGPNFHNLVELSDYVLEKCAFPYFSVTHGTYSKVKLNKSQLSTSGGLKIVSKYNKQFIGQFITSPNELDFDNMIIVEGNPRINELITHLKANGVPVETCSYEALSERILKNPNTELMKFATTKVKSSIPEHEALRFITSQCVRKIRTNRLDDSYMERLTKELETIERMGFCGVFYDVSKFSNAWGNMILRGSANNSLICFLLGISKIDPVKYALPFERFINSRKIYS